MLNEDQWLGVGRRSVGSVRPVLAASALQRLFAQTRRYPGAPGSIDDLRTQVQLLARDGAALDLRLAQLLDWFARQDLAELGYPSFAVFCRERVEWRSSWLRALRRLLRSPLRQVKLAAARGQISLRRAVWAPGRVDVEQQARWIAGGGQRHDAGCGLEVGSRAWQDVYSGDETRTIQEARRRARVLIGRGTCNAEVDAYILSAWQDGRTAASLLAEARAAPPPPDPTPGTWPDHAETTADSTQEDDPWDGLIGPSPSPPTCSTGCSCSSSSRPPGAGASRPSALPWTTSQCSTCTPSGASRASGSTATRTSASARARCSGIASSVASSTCTPSSSARSTRSGHRQCRALRRAGRVRRPGGPVARAGQVSRRPWREALRPPECRAGQSAAARPGPTTRAAGRRGAAPLAGRRGCGRPWPAGFPVWRQLLALRSASPGPSTTDCRPHVPQSTPGATLGCSRRPHGSSNRCSSPLNTAAARPSNATAGPARTPSAGASACATRCTTSTIGSTVVPTTRPT